MSESGKTKKLKLNPPTASSQTGTPQGSRAGSPTVIGSRGFMGSRASSPEGGVPMRGKFFPPFLFPSSMALFSRKLCTDIISTQAKIEYLLQSLLAAARVFRHRSKSMLLFPRLVFLAVIC